LEHGLVDLKRFRHFRMLHPEMPKTNDYRCIAPRGEEGGGGRRREEEGGGGRKRGEGVRRRWSGVSMLSVGGGGGGFAHIAHPQGIAMDTAASDSNLGAKWRDARQDVDKRAHHLPVVMESTRALALGLRRQQEIKVTKTLANSFGCVIARDCC